MSNWIWGLVFVGCKYPKKYLPSDEYERPTKVIERKHGATFTNNQKQELAEFCLRKILIVHLR